MTSVCLGLNSLWGCQLFYDGKIKKFQRTCLEFVRDQVGRFCKMEASVESLDWKGFLDVKTIDYKGDEVKVARWFGWKNISPALPKEIGKVPLSDICTLGCKEYVLNFDNYLKPAEQWSLGRSPKVMVEDQAWGSVCRGLVEAGVCCFLEEDEVFHVGKRPLLNGMFGVTKDDWTPEGVEIYRPIPPQ